MTDEELIQKFKHLLHFQGSGKSSEKEYQEIHDVKIILKKVDTP